MKYKKKNSDVEKSKIYSNDSAYETEEVVRWQDAFTVYKILYALRNGYNEYFLNNKLYEACDRLYCLYDNIEYWVDDEEKATYDASFSQIMNSIKKYDHAMSQGNKPQAYQYQGETKQLLRQLSRKIYYVIQSNNLGLPTKILERGLPAIFNIG